MKCAVHDLEVMDFITGWVELGVHSISVEVLLQQKKKKINNVTYHNGSQLEFKKKKNLASLSGS